MKGGARCPRLRGQISADPEGERQNSCESGTFEKLFHNSSFSWDLSVAHAAPGGLCQNLSIVLVGGERIGAARRTFGAGSAKVR
jgi:hypothetical protein